MTHPRTTSATQCNLGTFSKEAMAFKAQFEENVASKKLGAAKASLAEVVEFTRDLDGDAVSAGLKTKAVDDAARRTKKEDALRQRIAE